MCQRGLTPPFTLELLDGRSCIHFAKLTPMTVRQHPSSCVLSGGTCLAPPLGRPTASTCSCHPHHRANAHPCPPAHLAWPKKSRAPIPCASCHIVPTEHMCSYRRSHLRHASSQRALWCAHTICTALWCVWPCSSREVTASWPWVHGLFAVHMRLGKRRQKIRDRKFVTRSGDVTCQSFHVVNTRRGCALVCLQSRSPTHH
jgi:hypothetical protein